MQSRSTAVNMSEQFIVSTSVSFFKTEKFWSLLAKYSNLVAHVDSSLYNTS